MEFRRAQIIQNSGDRAYVHWETPTARLLPRLLHGRTTGPVFLAERRALALADIGRGRLSYPRAEYLFRTAPLLNDPHGAGHTLHQLRHSGSTHLAARGRTAAELQARSATLGLYVHLGEDTADRIPAEKRPDHQTRARLGVQLPRAMLQPSCRRPRNHYAD